MCINSDRCLTPNAPGCVVGLVAADPPAPPKQPLTFSLMLAASKDKVLAELKQQSLCLRQLELEYYIKRYSNIATQVRREYVHIVRTADPISMYKTIPASVRWALTHVRENASKYCIKRTPTSPRGTTQWSAPRACAPLTMSLALTDHLLLLHRAVRHHCGLRVRLARRDHDLGPHAGRRQ